MKTWKLQSALWVPHKPHQVFPFFADAGNLEAITPPELRFSIATPLPIEMRPGALIEYRLTLYGIRFRWLTEISVTTKESDNHFHYMDNRVLPEFVDAERATAEGWWFKPDYIINELNINSAIAYPGHQEVVTLQGKGQKYTMSGYCYSGGGRKVIRVEVEEISPDHKRYRVTGQLFFVSKVYFLQGFDVHDHPATITIDLSGVQIWDQTGVAALNQLTRKLERGGSTVFVEGLNQDSLNLLERIGSQPEAAHG